MTFEPTHEFRGLALRVSNSDDPFRILGIFEDAEGVEYHLPIRYVNKIQPKPKPGEVWRYDDPTNEDDPYPLVVITEDETGFRDAASGYEVMYLKHDLPNMTKVLNADGSPA